MKSIEARSKLLQRHHVCFLDILGRCHLCISLDRNTAYSHGLNCSMDVSNFPQRPDRARATSRMSLSRDYYRADG